MTVRKIGINLPNIAFGNIGGKGGDIPSAAKNEYNAIETVYIFAKPKAKVKAETKQYQAITKVRAFQPGTIDTSRGNIGDTLEPSSLKSSAKNTEQTEYRAITKVQAFQPGTIDTSAKMAGDSLELHELPTFMDELRRLGANLREFGKEFKGLIKRLIKA